MCVISGGSYEVTAGEQYLYAAAGCLATLPRYYVAV